MIVTTSSTSATTSGYVFRVSCTGTVTPVAHIVGVDASGAPLGAFLEQPDVAPLSFGAFGGYIFVGDEKCPFNNCPNPNGSLYAISPAGVVIKINTMLNGAPVSLPTPEVVRFIPSQPCSFGTSGQSFFLTYFPPNQVASLPPNPFAGLGGKLLILSEFSQQNYVMDSLGNLTPFGPALPQLEDATFANCPPPTPPTLKCPTATGKVGVAYSSSAPVSGGVAPFTFSVSAGALPAGLTLDTSTGAITGTPTSAGTFSFTIKVVDANGASAFSTCSSNCSAGTNDQWNFNVPTGTLGVSQDYTSNGITVTAYGFTNASKPTNLYGKNLSATESGLGLAAGANHEIETTTFIQLDISKMIAAGAQNPQMVINSVQAGEKYNVYGSNTLGVLGSLLIANGTAGNAPFAVPGYPTFKYIGVRAASGDVLLASVSAFSPGTCAIVVAPPSPPKNVCGLSPGYWKNHPDAWPVSSLTLGSQTYTKAELLALMSKPGGDASTILAFQLIAAKLNVLNGTNPATAGTNITDADALLSQFSGKLPYNVKPSSAIGAKMTKIADNLSNGFNNDGAAQPGCVASNSNDDDKEHDDDNDHEGGGDHEGDGDHH